MIFKNTWLWVVVALALLLASLWQYQHSRRAQPGPRKVLSQLSAAAVSNIQVRVGPQLEIQAERTNDSWGLTEPLRYPAEKEKVEALLAALEQMTPAIYITRRELMNRSNPDEEYGLATPQATIILKQGDYRSLIHIGARTAPGDQVFLQVVGDEGIYVVDAGLLNLIPKKADDWRATRLLDLKAIAFDRISITNSGKGFEIRKDGTNQAWKIVTSDFSARAQASKVDELLHKIQDLRVQQFVPDDPKADLEVYGLQTPEFQFAVADGTNLIAALQFGKGQTNDAKQVFSRKGGEKAVVTVNRERLIPWPSLLDFRDPHLIGSTERPSRIEVHGTDNFSLLHETNDTWKVFPQNFVADSASVKDLLQVLSNMTILQFVQDIAPEQVLAKWGLDKPALEYVLGESRTNGVVSAENPGAVRLQFSTNQEDKVYVRRSDETSVYAVKADEKQRLPTVSWQLKDRRIWKYSIEDLSAVSIQHYGKTRRILRKGDHLWVLAPGSQGVVEPLPTEETLLDLVNLSAMVWVRRAEQNPAAFGFCSDDQRITLEFRDGEKRTVEISPKWGSESGIEYGLASVTLEGEIWIFAIPGNLRRDISAYLSIPAETL